MIFQGVLLILASFMNLASTALLGFFLADLMIAEDFGITRVASSYYVVLSMVGGFTLHDALSSFLAKTKLKSHQQALYVSATLMVLSFSTAAAVLFAGYLIIFSDNQPNLTWALLMLTLSLPFICLSTLYTASTQATGSHRLYSGLTLLAGLLPLLILLPLAYGWGVVGWVWGRVMASMAMSGICIFALRAYFPGWSLWLNVTPKRRMFMHKLWRYGRVQIISGVLSLVMLSMDIIFLEYFTSDLIVVANYGLALLFCRSFLVFPAVLGRLYFKSIANIKANSSQVKVLHQFLGYHLIMAGIAVGLLISAVPWFIHLLYGNKYHLAEQLLGPMSIGVLFNFIWNALSVTNVALGRTRESTWISLCGALVGLILMMVLIPTYGALGAAWSINLCFATGVFFGLIRLKRSGYI